MQINGVSAPSGAAGGDRRSAQAEGTDAKQYQQAVQSASSVLGTAVSGLRASGNTQSLTELAAAKGVSSDALETAIKDGLKQAGSKLSGAKLDAVAHRIATAKPHEASGASARANGAATARAHRAASGPARVNLAL